MGEAGKLIEDDLLKVGVPAGTDPENLCGFRQGQEGPQEPPHYSLTGVGILLRMGGGPDKLDYLVKSWSRFYRQ